MNKRKIRTSKDILWVIIISIIAIFAIGQMIALFASGGHKSGNTQNTGNTQTIGDAQNTGNAENTGTPAQTAGGGTADGNSADGSAADSDAAENTAAQTQASSEEAKQETEAAAETETATETETETAPADLYADKPDIDPSDWMYILANPWNSIGEYAPELTQFRDVQIDYRIYDAMNAFVTDAEAQGLTVVMTSGYRSYDTQSWLFQRKVEQYGGDEATAATIVARPGTSEHQTGLAADITDGYYEYMNESLEETALFQWMSAHCHEYGFIVRFPRGRQDVTGIMYEPWHYRYVGKEAAAYIMEHDLTLEEFLSLYDQDDQEADQQADQQTVP